MLKSIETAVFWQSSCTISRTFSVGLLKNPISSTKFYIFKSGNLVEENLMYQQLQKLLGENFSHKSLSGKFEEI